MIVNSTGTNDQIGVDSVSLSNILETNSSDVNKLWAHCIGLYAFTLYAFHLMRLNYRHYRTQRQQFFLAAQTAGGEEEDVRLVGDTIANRTMVVYNVPKDYRTSEQVMRTPLLIHPALSLLASKQLTQPRHPSFP